MDQEPIRVIPTVPPSLCSLCGKAQQADEAYYASQNVIYCQSCYMQKPRQGWLIPNK